MKASRWYRAYLFATLFVTGGCGEKLLIKDELKAFVLNQENGLYKVYESKPYKIEVMYRPLDLIVEQNIESHNPAEIRNERARLDSLDYFVIKLSKGGQEIENDFAGDNERYLQVTNYLNGGIAADLSINCGNRTIKPEMVLFAPSFGSSNGSTILLAFKSKIKSQHNDAVLIFHDSLFGLGRCEFTFQATAIRNCPKLKF